MHTVINHFVGQAGSHDGGNGFYFTITYCLFSDYYYSFRH